MNWGGPTFVIAIIAICYGGWILNNWIRARHGYPLEDEWGGKTDQKLPDAERKIGLLTNEMKPAGQSQPSGRTGRSFGTHRHRQSPTAHREAETAKAHRG